MEVDDEGHVVIVDAESKTYINKEIAPILKDAPDKAIIIEDKNGDQWVVQKDGKVTRVPAGGLSPNMDVVVSEEALDLVKASLRELYQQYNTDNLAAIERELVERRKQCEDHCKKHNDEILQSVSNESEADNEEIGEPLLFNGTRVDVADAPGTNSDFEKLSYAEKEKELEHNRGILLNFLG